MPPPASQLGGALRREGVKMRRLTLVLGLLLVLTLGLGVVVERPQPARAASDNVVLQWDQVTLQAIAATRTGPTVAARALAVVHTAIYDAWAAYDPVALGTRLLGGLRQPSSERTQANKEKAISYAAYITLLDLFPTQSAFDQQMTTLGYATDGTDPSAPVRVGTTAAQAVLDYRHHDGANQLGDEPDRTTPDPTKAYADYTGYQPINTWDQIKDPDHWQPLCVLTATGVQDGMPPTPPAGTSCDPPDYRLQTFLTPFWPRVTPFSLTSSSSQFRPDHGPAMSVEKGKPNSNYVKEVDQQLTYSANLTDLQKTIAQYWEDGPGSITPPGHWCVFAQWLSRRDKRSLDGDAKVFMALTNALLDASITAWDAKQVWTSVRPITAVHWLKQGQLVQAWGGPYQETKWIRAEDWQPYQVATFVTPPFAEYLSGHSTFSGAAAALLKLALGSDTFGMSVTIPAGSSTVEPGVVPASPVTLSWKSFGAAADQAGISREYGGIHFKDGDFEARNAGDLVGQQVWAKVKHYFDGKATATT